MASLAFAAILIALTAHAWPTRPALADAQSQRITIDYWEKWTGIEADAMRAVVDDFNASQDSITVRFLSTSAIDQKLMLAISAQRPPDVAGLWSHTVNVYAEKNALLPLDAMLRQAGVTREQYIPVFWDICSHRGFTWALPATPATLALHWNRANFREAGLDPDDAPASIAELDAMAERLTVVDVRRGGRSQRLRYTELTDTEKSAKTFEIVQLGFSPAVPGWWNSLWGYWFGGRLWDGESTVTPDSAANRAAFEWFQSYPKKYGVQNLRAFGASFGNFSSPQDPFLSGKVAMVLQGVWLQNFIDKYAPQLDWAAAPMPSVDPQTLKDVTLVECDTLVIPRGSKHPDEAFEFIRFVNTQPEMEKLCLGQGKTSPLAKVSDDYYARHRNRFARLFADLSRSPNALYVPRCNVWNEYNDDMTAAADRMGLMQQSAAEALSDVRQRVQWKLDRVNRRWKLVGEERMRDWRADVHEK